MEKKKIYIFFTYGMNGVSGAPMYTAGKTLYLEKIGWRVFFCHPGTAKEPVLISAVENYVKNGASMPVLLVPPYRLCSAEQEKVLNFIIRKFGLSDFENFEIIVESHEATFAYWAELFAAKVGGRHFFMALHEGYRNMPGKERYIEDNLDFFYFKWQRNELVGYPLKLQKLFNGYKNVTAPLTEMPSTTAEMYPIADVDFPQFHNIKKLDWNICHIGRPHKTYVPYLIEGVGELARRHPDKKINFIFVGDVDSREDIIKQNLRNLPNVQLTVLGYMSPIPRILFSKVDVICAIAQSARFAANEGVLTICANFDVPEKTPGILGYDTDKQLYGEPTFSYVEALENVLVKRIYDGKKSFLPKLESPESKYEKFWTVVENAAKNKEYYTERLSQDRIRTWFAPFPFVSIARNAKIIFVGATEIADDYRKQIMCQEHCKFEISSDGVKKLDEKPYCQLLTTIDEHPEDFDDSVVGFERLKQLDYDAIVLTVYTSDVDRVREKILKMVPQMADRIVCNLKFIDIYRLKHKNLVLFED